MLGRLKRKYGFTLVEVMISVAVISIGILGACAAIAFGLRASDRGAKGTFALNLNQRTLEMMLNGYPTLGYATALGLNTATFPDADPAGVYDQPENDPLWHPVFGTGFSGQNVSPYVLKDFVPDSRPTDQANFTANATQYQTNLNIQWVNNSTTTSSTGNLILLSASTRWHDKGSWHGITTTAYGYGKRQ